jgi:hypothetical protein
MTSVFKEGVAAFKAIDRNGAEYQELRKVGAVATSVGRDLPRGRAFGNREWVRRRRRQGVVAGRCALAAPSPAEAIADGPPNDDDRSQLAVVEAPEKVPRLAELRCQVVEKRSADRARSALAVQKSDEQARAIAEWSLNANPRKEFATLAGEPVPGDLATKRLIPKATVMANEFFSECNPFGRRQAQLREDWF